jgi:hypothetical protein
LQLDSGHGEKMVCGGDGVKRKPWNRLIMTIKVITNKVVDGASGCDMVVGSSINNGWMKLKG